ncbi:hypothetical protein [Nitratiruptor tergarcus]|uniref:Uncharacterized protein n=1 Tax=Nitratiruptor tergarcus DSM 16512 TaxID=1069081 RepID=A0A1W1WUH6_9BACT|nr:hypothetical protein [Nitratiruptor tergarcus]SMC09896.1 hypothetical protein SAMN05660197_1718 [Nitratiruptor tergarcus DSM 16512]
MLKKLAYTLLAIGAISLVYADSNAKEYCQQHGGIWADGVCLSQTYTSSQPNYHNSDSNIVYALKSREIKIQGYFANFGQGAYDWIYRPVGGGLYKLNGLDPDTGYFQWTDLTKKFVSVSVKQGKIVIGDSNENQNSNIVNTLKNREIKIQGYFANFGQGAYDWIYRPVGGGLYKLNGLDPDTGYFQWTDLTKKFVSVSVKQGKIAIGNSTLGSPFPGL